MAAYVITGNEIDYVSGVDGKGFPSPAQIPLSLAQQAAYTIQSVPQGASYQTNAATSATTLTAANVGGAGPGLADEVYLNMTGTLGAGAVLTLPTVAALVAQIPNAVVGSTYVLRVINSGAGAFSWTVTTNTGWTIAGAVAVAQNTWKEYAITLTSLSAATLQYLGTGTY